MPRIAAFAIAAALLLAAALGTRGLSAARAQARRDALSQAAEGAKDRAQDAIKNQLSSVEGRAQAAVSIPVLRAQLGIVDAATLKDGFNSEPWWEPVRRDFPIYGVAAGDTPDILVGAEASGLDFGALIKAAHQRRQASAMMSGTDTAVVAGAATLDATRGGQPYVIFLARPLDTSFLEDVAERTKGGALLSDGKRVLLAAGPDQESLKKAVGKESAGTFDGETWAASATPLAQNLWLWTSAKPRIEAPKAPVDTIVIWAVAGLGAAGAIAFGLRKPARKGLAEQGVEVEPATEQVPAPRVGVSNPRVSSPRVGVSNPGTKPIRSDPGKTARTGTHGKTTDPGVHPKTSPVERPKQFGRYWLVDRLGEGGMAEVYTAVAFGAENFRRAFVVKLLHSGAQRTEALVEMFIDEAKLASNLVHSNIIPVYDFGKMGDEFFMAQEYVLGRDLRRLTTQAVKVDGKPLDPAICVYIARNALNALEYAHTRMTDDGKPMGIVHRDVSPNNILASARGEVKLFDFGIAKADEGRVHQTQVGVVKGNVQYMSPEQARGEPVDARADVCSMGLVLYFLLTGRSLYRGDSAFNLLVQSAQGLTPELLPMLEKLPPQLAQVLRVALEPDREQRFHSAAAFENALATLPTASATDLQREMQRLFGEELKAEQARFASIEPPPADTEEMPPLEEEPV